MRSPSPASTISAAQSVAASAPSRLGARHDLRHVRLGPSTEFGFDPKLAVLARAARDVEIEEPVPDRDAEHQPERGRRGAWSR